MTAAHAFAAASPVPPAAAIDGEGVPNALPVTPSLGTATGPEFLAYLDARAAHENSAGLHPGAALYAPYFSENDDLHGQHKAMESQTCSGLFLPGKCSP
ncbi:hypothetical protein [Pseudoroseomonas cervicalis]|uniref:hypothetical protein n=1 Tax=Teichococcus cervicalis TaxID=204525 RepID=UPI0027845D69|nr:hypothetical protein [Pseudoroseomonas cervicalis]MDQ1077983.1 hypothetical protein [Pseudoroseomonas cervicalis]